MDKVNELKIRAYDLMAMIQTLQSELMAVNSEIGRLMSQTGIPGSKAPLESKEPPKLSDLK